MIKNLVSVIIPSYNSGKYINSAIDSVLNQTYKEIELIIIDDGSTDKTKEILVPYINSNKIKYFRQKNKGLAGARNEGIKASKGEYISFLDADDLFLSTKIEEQVKFLKEHPKCDICYCDLWHFNQDSPSVMMKLDNTYYSGNDVFKNLLRRNFINPLTVVIRKSAINRFGVFNENFRCTEDWEYWVNLAWQGAQFCFLPKILAKYQIGLSNTNMSNLISGDLQRMKEVEIFENLKKKMTKDERKKYKINSIILYHKVKFFYAYLSKYFSFLKKIQLWFRGKRLKFVSGQ